MVCVCDEGLPHKSQSFLCSSIAIRRRTKNPPLKRNFCPKVLRRCRNRYLWSEFWNFASNRKRSFVSPDQSVKICNFVIFKNKYVQSLSVRYNSSIYDMSIIFKFCSQINSCKYQVYCYYYCMRYYTSTGTSMQYSTHATSGHSSSRRAMMRALPSPLPIVYEYTVHSSLFLS